MMLSRLSPCLLCCLTLLSLGSLAGCAGGEVMQSRSGSVVGDRPDLSGHWERNFQRSDDFGNRTSLYGASVRSQIRQQGNTESGIRIGGVSRGGGVNVDAINGMLRFVEELTRTIVFEIEQDEGQISIEREGDFPLRCSWQGTLLTRTENAFGSDICGWNGDQLLIQMTLGAGLNIGYQFTLSPDEQLLNVTTTVNTEMAPVPFVLSHVYQRFTPPSDDYDCTLTLTRNRVCRQRGSP